MNQVAGVFVRAAQGEPVDLLVWRHYGRTAGIVEAVLDANPGIANLGTVLPLGTILFLPNIPKPVAAPPTVSLWG